jgi:putative multiple sugar transport system permease protein
MSDEIATREPDVPSPERPATEPATRPQGGGVSGALHALRLNLRQYGMIIALVLIVVLFQVLTDGILLRPLNVTNVIMQNSYILVLAIGMMLVIINGHIDLSVGSVAAFVGALSGVAIVQWGWPWHVTVVACLLVGAVIGAWQGFWIARVHIPSFIVTLAGMLIFRGLTFVTLQGQSIAPFPGPFRAMASGFLPTLIGGSRFHLITLVLGLVATVALAWAEWHGRMRRQRYGLPVVAFGWFVAKIAALALVINAFAYTLADYAGLPVVGLILIALILGYSYLMSKTVLGRHIYATGGNEKAAMLSGVKTSATTFWVFVNMGVLSALAGLMFTARLNAATPRAGTLFELDAIAAAFIGGAAMSGGVGTVIGAIIGGFVMGVMNNGMSLLSVGVDWQQFIKGMVLLLAVAFDVYNKNKAK